MTTTLLTLICFALFVRYVDRIVSLLCDLGESALAMFTRRNDAEAHVNLRKE